MHLPLTGLPKATQPVPLGGWLSCTGTTVDRSMETGVYHSCINSHCANLCKHDKPLYIHVHSYVYSKEILEQSDHTARLKRTQLFVLYREVSLIQR